MTLNNYEIVLTPSAKKAIAEGLPEPVAIAVIEFFSSSLMVNPHRVGKPLRDAYRPLA